jgi:hypothetical protein
MTAHLWSVLSLRSAKRSLICGRCGRYPKNHNMATDHFLIAEGTGSIRTRRYLCPPCEAKFFQSFRSSDETRFLSSLFSQQIPEDPPAYNCVNALLVALLSSKPIFRVLDDVNLSVTFRQAITAILYYLDDVNLGGSKLHKRCMNEAIIIPQRYVQTSDNG